MSAYQRIARITIAATLFLIGVGGIVRGSGAGLGCPDWPKCFGMWFPPTSVGQIPPEWWAAHPNASPAEFNVVHTMTEYVNRLIGVSVGLLILFTFFRSLKYRRIRPAVTYCSALAAMFVAFEGWLGGVVVESQLKPLIVTAHMLFAILILLLLLYAAYIEAPEKSAVVLPSPARERLIWLVGTLFAVSFVQMLIGTQVRESIEEVAAILPNLSRDKLLEQVGFLDHFHRSSSWVVLALSAGVFLLCREGRAKTDLGNQSNLNLALVVAQVLAGVGLAYAGLPPALQVAHLVLGASIIASQFWFLLRLTRVGATSRIEGASFAA